MAGKCGCAGTSCSCKIESYDGSVTVQGIGTAADPYRLSAAIAAIDDTVLKFTDTATVKWTITGNGTALTPRVVRADIMMPANGVPVPVFTTGARPAANTVGVGTTIWNSTTKQLNTSDGAAWYKPDGTAA